MITNIFDIETGTFSHEMKNMNSLVLLLTTYLEL